MVWKGCSRCVVLAAADAWEGGEGGEGEDRSRLPSAGLQGIA